MLTFDSNKCKTIFKLYYKLQDSALRTREVSERQENGRSEYERDCSRILYSSSFRRLQGKMQLMGIESTAFHRNRLTHSLEVSRIARSIARILNIRMKQQNQMYREDELCLLDTAAWGHDIGHPAFGHKGERVLDEIARVYGLRFEGNAQNYRVLRKLDRHGIFGTGLNLTYRTLLAINKYCFSEKDSCDIKKFMYDEDYEFLKKFREKHKLGLVQTLDAQIIELADDIAYAVHDLEDGLFQGVITVDEVLYAIKCSKYCPSVEAKDRERALKLFKKYVESVRRDVDKVDTHNQQEYLHIFRKRLTTQLTDKFVKSLDFDENTNTLVLETAHSTLCSLLKEITLSSVARNTDVIKYEARGQIIIKTLFNIYADESKNVKFLLLPPDYRPKSKSSKDIAESVINYIAGMMDDFAIEQYESLTGISYNGINIGDMPEIYNIEKSRSDKQ